MDLSNTSLLVPRTMAPALRLAEALTSPNLTANGPPAEIVRASHLHHGVSNEPKCPPAQVGKHVTGSHLQELLPTWRARLCPFHQPPLQPLPILLCPAIAGDQYLGEGGGGGGGGKEGGRLDAQILMPRPTHENPAAVQQMLVLLFLTTSYSNMWWGGWSLGAT